MNRRIPVLGTAILLCTGAGMLGLSVPAASAAPTARTAATSSATFVKAYAEILNGAQVDLAPVDVQATADGGSIAIALAASPKGLGVDWLVKLSAAGVPQWQEQVGCTSLQGAPGDYADGVSVQQTADGGYIAAGVFLSASQDAGAFLLKLDSAGTVQWQRDLGPAGATQAYFNSVQPAAGGGYVAAGYYVNPTASAPLSHVLVAKFGPGGSLAWQHGFATPNGNGRAFSLIQTADGGYALAGDWNNSTLNSGNGAQGALLLKLDAGGTLQWQKAYSGGVYCFFNGFSETCTDVGAFGYSVHQTSDGGYVLAGDSTLELADSAPIEPWQAKVDATGNLVWQHVYYQTYITGRPLGEFFPASAPAPGGGSLAVGPTEDYSTQKNLLFAVKADSSGLAGTCPDVHPATPLQAISPRLTAVAPPLPLQTATTSAAASPIGTLATSISTQTDC